MLGAIIGDLAGSIYEFNQTKFVKKIKIKNIIENNSFFSELNLAFKLKSTTLSSTFIICSISLNLPDSSS